MHDILGRLNALNTPSKQTTSDGKNILKELKPVKNPTLTRLVESYENFKKNYEKMDSEPAIDRKRKAKQKRDGVQYTKQLNKDVGASVFRNKRGVSEDIDIDTFYEDTMKELDAMGGQCDCGDCEECNNRDKEKVNESILKESSLDMIASQFPKEVRDFSRGAEMSEDLYYALYDFYSPDMPYGTKKARDGDPMEWVARHFDDAIQNGEVHITESNLNDEDTSLGTNNDGTDAEFGDDGLDNRYSSDFGDNGLGDMDVIGDNGSFGEFGSSDIMGDDNTMGDFSGMGDSYGSDDELNELARLAGLDNPGNKTFGIDEVYESDDMKEKDLTQESYSEKNPKIDLYCDGKYVASTNYSKTVKEAIKKYKEKYPEKKGKITGEINKKQVSENTAKSWVSKASVNEEADYNEDDAKFANEYIKLAKSGKEFEAAMLIANYIGNTKAAAELNRLYKKFGGDLSYDKRFKDIYDDLYAKVSSIIKNNVSDTQRIKKYPFHVKGYYDNVNESEEYDNNYAPQDLVQAYNELTHYNQHTEAAIELATFLGRDDLIPRLRKLQDAIDDPRASNSERNAWLSKRDAIANVLYHNPKVQKAFAQYDVKTPTRFEWDVVDSSTQNVIDTIPTSKDRKEARAKAVEMGYDMNDVFIRPKKSVNESNYDPANYNPEFHDDEFDGYKVRRTDYHSKSGDDELDMAYDKYLNRVVPSYGKGKWNGGRTAISKEEFKKKRDDMQRELDFIKYRKEKNQKDFMDRQEKLAQEYKNDPEKFLRNHIMSAEEAYGPTRKNRKNDVNESMLPQAYDTQQSGMNINSSLDTRTGTKSLSVTATGEDAEQLAQILRMAGIGSEQTQEPNSDCYGTQDMGKHIAMLRVSQPIEEDFANEPDEEYVPLDTILDQGTDLNRKKTQHSHSYKQGDNPMAMEGQKMFSKLYKVVKGK